MAPNLFPISLHNKVGLLVLVCFLFCILHPAPDPVVPAAPLCRNPPCRAHTAASPFLPGRRRWGGANVVVPKVRPSRFSLQTLFLRKTAEISRRYISCTLSSFYVFNSLLCIFLLLIKSFHLQLLSYLQACFKLLIKLFALSGLNPNYDLYRLQSY